MIKKIAVFSFFIAGLFIASCIGAFAQSENGYHSPATSMQYTKTAYPEGNAYFYLPANFETEIFEVVNGKFFNIQYFEYFSDPKANFEVHFYTPCGVEFGVVYVDSKNASVSVPHKANTLLPEKLKVKIVNRSKTNKDFKFVMFTPTNAIPGVPCEKSKPVCADGCCGYTE